MSELKAKDFKAAKDGIENLRGVIKDVVQGLSKEACSYMLGVLSPQMKHQVDELALFDGQVEIAELVAVSEILRDLTGIVELCSLLIERLEKLNE